jgi:hypothetical protein
MKSSNSHLIAAAFSLSALILSSTDSYGVTFDFETIPGGAPTVYDQLVGTSYQSLGVVFSSQGDLNPANYPVFRDNITPTMAVVDTVRELQSTFNIRADFLNGAGVVSADTYTANGFGLTMSAYDVSDSLLGSVTAGPYTLGVGQFLSLSGIGTISYIIWESSNPTFAGVSIDNLTFEASVVPVPPALPLFAGGLGLLGWLSRRKRKGADRLKHRTLAFHRHTKSSHGLMSVGT